MALTKVSRGLLSTSIVDNGNATAITIDSSENVGIGVTSPSSYYMDDLVVSAPNEGGITIASDSTSAGAYLAFADGTSGDTAYRGFVHYAHASDYLRFGTAAAERMRIDSSGNVGIGLTNPSDFYAENLVVAAGAEGGITIKSSTSHHAYLMFADGTSGSDAYRGYLGHNHNTESTSLVSFGKIGLSSVAETKFTTNSAERMRIDSSGNLLVGTTVTDTAAVGFRYRSSLDAISSVADGGISAYFGRRTSDGDIVAFRKNDAIVGSIGASSGYTKITSGDGTNGSGLQFGDSKIYPVEANSVVTDNAVDFGDSNYRFKDLYLSGGVYLGGTGAANKLDDYEEGTFTPFLDASSTDPSLSYSTQVGAYEKIGALVHASFFINVSAVNSQGSGTLRIAGLPFNASSNVNANEVPAVLLQTEPFNAGDGAGYQQFARTNGNSNVLFMGYKTGTGSASIPAGASHVGTGYLIGHIVYRTLS
jgi:hypothetical protein